MRAVVAINPMQVGHVWPAVEPLVSAALEHGDGGYTEADVLDEIRQQRLVLWLGLNEGHPEMMMTTEIVARPRNKVVFVRHMAGRDFGEWQKAGEPRLLDFAKAEGCVAILGDGRMGWSRLKGWKRDTVTMRKEV
jgi:hypothetical protein